LEKHVQRYAAILLIIGAIIFAAAVVSPPIYNVFSVSDPAQQLTVVQDNLTGWRIANAFMAVGASSVVVGIVVLARYMISLNDRRLAKWAIYAGAALMVLGGVLWLVGQFDNMTESPENIVNGQPLLGEWVFITYTLSTLIGLLFVGLALYAARYPRWLGWGCMGISGFILIRTVLYQDPVPLEWYIVAFILGLILLFVKPSPKGVTEVSASGEMSTTTNVNP
jgi:hypothetical protein